MTKTDGHDVVAPGAPGSKGTPMTVLPDPTPPEPTPRPEPVAPPVVAAVCDDAGPEPQEAHFFPHPPLSIEEIATAERVLTARGWLVHAWNKPSAPARYDSADGARTMTLGPDACTLTVEAGDEALLAAVLDALLAANTGNEASGRLDTLLTFTGRAHVVETLRASGTVLEDHARGNPDGTCVLVAESTDYSIPHTIGAAVSRAALMAGLVAFAEGVAATDYFTLAPPITRCPPGFEVRHYDPATGRAIFGLNAMQVDVPRQLLRGYTLVAVTDRVEHWQKFDALGNAFFIAKREYQRPRHGLSKG